MITIEYAGGDVQGICNYRVKINRKLICIFEHDSAKGHAECLQKAADAVALNEWAELAIINDLKGG
jgi:hypothetical protein